MHVRAVSAVSRNTLPVVPGYPLLTLKLRTHVSRSKSDDKTQNNITDLILPIMDQKV